MHKSVFPRSSLKPNYDADYILLLLALKKKKRFTLACKYKRHSFWMLGYLGGVFLLTNINSASIQAFHCEVEALSFLTEPVRHWNRTVLKYHGPGRLRVPAHLEDRLFLTADWLNSAI